MLTVSAKQFYKHMIFQTFSSKKKKKITNNNEASHVAPVNTNKTEIVT